MDLDEFRTILGNSGVNIWEFIDTATKVATLDYGDELIAHRDDIVANLYAKNCPICDNTDRRRVGVAKNAVVAAVFGVEEDEDEDEDEERNKGNSPATPVSIGGNEDDEYVPQHVEQEQRFVVDDEEVEDEFDEQRRIVSIKEQIEDPQQTEDSLVDLLQTLADMDITFKALKETDIGRHVNRLRKNPSSEVRKLVKLLVRRWKDLVDEWVRSNTPGEVHSSSNLMADGDSPQQNISRNQQNGHYSQVPDFGYSPNPHNGSSGSDKSEPKPKAAPSRVPPSRRDPPAKTFKSASPASAPPPNRQKEVVIDPERLASARRRLQENYQEAQNAKKQRTIQVMDIHEIPKPRNSFFGRNKGGFQRH